jgi:uncharacterized protein (DUF1684 family)
MKTNTILIIGVLTVIVLAVIYTLTGTDNPETYIENVEKERERQYKFIRFNIESPLTDEQKRTFGELEYFPIDPSYKVRAKMVPLENKKMVELPMTDGTLEKYLQHSHAEFELKGQIIRLLLLQSQKDPDRRNFFLAFADATSGEETYGGGRYINLRQDGKNSITIDFNLAYNPYCAYNPDFACPLPPRENILEIPINAGEKDYKKEEG